MSLEWLLAMKDLSIPSTDSKCRLCDGNLEKRFSLRVLNKYDVAYFECQNCKSLQTEQPYWLVEAYQSLSNLDTGAAQKNITNLTACYAVAKILNLKNVLDFGGGSGLLCRLLRDYEINCYVVDKYSTPTYGLGYTEPDFQSPDLLLALEVFEHFPNPQTDLEQLFASSPKAVLVSTLLFSGQGSHWWYLAEESGQHVFFYSNKAIGLISQKFGYLAAICGGYVLFVKGQHTNKLKTATLRFLLHRIPLRIVRVLMCFLPTKGVWRDLEKLRGKGT